MKVQIFIPCFIDQLYPTIGFNMVKVLEKAGCEVIYNAQQTCCGQPAFNAGFWGESKEVCTKFLDDFEGAEYIVAPSASCIGFVRNYYPKIFDNSAHLQKAKKIKNEARLPFLRLIYSIICHRNTYLCTGHCTMQKETGIG